MFEYETFYTVYGEKIAELCNDYARKGWRVHSFIRSDSSPMPGYRVLLERDVEKDFQPKLFEGDKV